MVSLHGWFARTTFMALVASAVLFATVYPGGMATGSPLPALTSISLGDAASFAVLGGSTVTNTGSSVITGNLGVSPGSAVTGFPPGTVTGGTIHAADALALQAQNSVVTAYDALKNQTPCVNLTGQDLGGLTLTPGVYCFSSSAGLTGVLTLDGLGDPSAAWVFQIGSTLTTASGSSVVLTNGATSCNVFWQVTSSATLGTTTHFVGNILALTSITLNTDANILGRALARNGAVTLDSNTVNIGSCADSTATLIGGAIGVVRTATPTATPTAPYGEVEVGKFTGSDCTSNLQPEAGVRFSIGSQDFLTGRVAPGIDRQIIAAGSSKVTMQGRAGWSTCVRVIDPSNSEILRQDFGDGATVLVNVPVYQGKTTKVYVTNIKIAVVATPTAPPTPVTATSTPAPSATPVPTQTPTVVVATALPRTGGDPYGMLMIWLALGGAGTAVLGYSIRRRSR